MRSIARERFSWPSVTFAHVGEFASSKSAMKTLAPELSALITIFASTGPVISTRRSWRSAGAGRHAPVARANGRGLRKEVGQLARAQALGALVAAREQLLALSAELALEHRHELARLLGQDGHRRASFNRSSGLSPRIDASTSWIGW